MRGANDNTILTWNDEVKPDALIGHTFNRVYRWENDPTDTISFRSDSATFHLYHYQECYECVSIEDICGDLSDLENSPIIRCEIRTNIGEAPQGYETHEFTGENDNSGTWTFIEIATNKGSVTIRFFGTSNGYYSETADFYIERLR
jgi:hypothetical protein